MNKEELTALVAEILGQTRQEAGSCAPQTPAPARKQAPAVKSAETREQTPEGEEAADVTRLDLRKLYLVENPQNGEAFQKLKLKTPARLGNGKCGARYKTVTMLRFRADHAAAQDSVFSQIPEDFAEKNGMIEVKTRCRDKEEYLKRPDLGRTFDAENQDKIRAAVPQTPVVQIVVGDGLSSAAILENSMNCMAALLDGLKIRGIPASAPIFVRYCRVGAGDAVGDVTGCELVCVLVGERPGLVTDKSMSAYLTYRPHTGVSESCRTVVSNIHAQGTPAVEAGAYLAELIEKILKRKVSGVGLHLEAAR